MDRKSQFAAAALTGLLARPGVIRPGNPTLKVNTSDPDLTAIVQQAWQLAELMEAAAPQPAKVVGTRKRKLEPDA